MNSATKEPIRGCARPLQYFNLGACGENKSSRHGEDHKGLGARNCWLRLHLGRTLGCESRVKYLHNKDIFNYDAQV